MAHLTMKRVDGSKSAATESTRCWPNDGTVTKKEETHAQTVANCKTQYIDLPVVIRGQDPIPRGTTNHASIAQIVSTEIVAIARVQLLVKVVGTDGCGVLGAYGSRYDENRGNTPTAVLNNVIDFLVAEWQVRVVWKDHEPQLVTKENSTEGQDKRPTPKIKTRGVASRWVQV